ncbi:MAG: hypothetical protein LC770_14040 [Acidobacteria bacterium]|nr:hypothetical protein [Acidobacteriota bacterium]
MRLPLSGFVFLLGYVTLIGVASFLEKFSVKQLNPYQVNFLMAVGTGLPLWYHLDDCRCGAAFIAAGMRHATFGITTLKEVL